MDCMQGSNFAINDPNNKIEDSKSNFEDTFKYFEYFRVDPSKSLLERSNIRMFSLRKKKM